VKSFDWANLLRHHPIFSALSADDVQRLLADDASDERSYPAGTTIIHVDEVGDSLFLVGGGAVEVVLPMDNGKQFSLAVLRKGEIFGEMALLEGRPRSASAVAWEACELLEMRGRAFRHLLDAHPDIEVKVLLKVSERLRAANEQILDAQFRGVDEKLRLFNDKLDVEHRIVDASLRAAQTVFDQTKQRADEVISSFERTRTLLQVAGSVIGGIVTLLVAGLGYFGYNELRNVRDVAREARAGAETVKADMKVVEEAKAGLVTTRDQLEETRKVMLGLLRASFSEAADRDDVGDVVAAYKQMRALLGQHEPMPEALFNYVEIRMRRASAERPTDWSDLLALMADDARRAGTDRQEAWASYLLLAHSALAKPEAFDQVFARFQATMAEQQRRGLKPDDTDREMVRRLSELVARADQRRKQLFDRVVAVVRAS
jgi:CRP/FNR family transcriptional regulator, cyclic AMP receptor protein